MKNNDLTDPVKALPDDLAEKPAWPMRCLAWRLTTSWPPTGMPASGSAWIP